MDRVAAARARLGEAIAFAGKAREAGPPCSQCRYKTLLDMCSNPALTVQEFNPAKGAYAERAETKIEQARAEDGLCGPEALLFDPIPLPITLGVSVVKGSWFAVRALGISFAALLFLLWLLR